MRYQAALLITIVLAVSAAAALGIAAQGSQGSADPGPSAALTQRPSVTIIGHGVPAEGGPSIAFFQTCFSDAHVILVDGVIEEVTEVAPDVGERVRPGLRVEGLVGGFASGRSEFAVPVHLDADGNLVSGYAECVEGDE